MATAVQQRRTERDALDRAVARVKEAAPTWARLPLREKIAVARSMQRGYLQVAGECVKAACEAKGLPLGTPLEGEEWLANPWTVVRSLRLVIEALTALERGGNTPVGPVSRTADGRVCVRVFPGSALDGQLFPKVTAEVHLEAGVTEEQMHAERALFHKRPGHEGKVSLVLGAGNVNAIPTLDVVTKLFNEGKTCVLKLNPVNDYLGPFLERAFEEPIRRGFLAVVYGAGEEGGYLAGHAGVDELHITGSDRTHDLIVWGPPGPGRAARMARGDPLLRKEISSELGSVTPVIVLPGPYTEKELAFQIENLAGAVTTNASFMCVAAKMLITPRGWGRRDELLQKLGDAFAATPLKRAYYPGAEQRYRALLEGRAGVRTFGVPKQGELPWALVPGLDPEDRTDRAFRDEPFCPLLFETSVGGPDPLEFLDAAVSFANERLWGTLSAMLVVHPTHLADPKLAAAIERAVVRLRYGVVAVNLWTAAAFAMGSTPWGAHPSSPLTDIQGGRGFVHNTSMIERIEKVVVRAPVKNFPKLPHFPSHRTAHVLGRRLTALDEHGSWFRLPALIAAAVRG